MCILNVETDIIPNIRESPIGKAVILVIMYVETFKTVVIISHNVFDITLTDNIQYGQSIVYKYILLVRVICEKYRLRGEANIPSCFSVEGHLTVLETGIFRK